MSCLDKVFLIVDSFQHVLGLELTRKILIHNFRQVGQRFNAKPNGNLGEGGGGGGGDLDAWS